MGYEVEISIDLKKNKNGLKTVDSLIECIEHLPDSNYWHYCLQLNTYKAIIEEKYGKKVDEMYLVCLHPENKNKSYQRIKVEDLQKEVGELFKLRKGELL